MEKPLKGSLSKKFPYYIGWEAFWCSVGARLRLGPSKHAGFVATASGARTYRWWGRCEPSWMRKGASLSFPWYSSPPLATQLVPVGNKLENETGRSFHLSLSLSALGAAGSPFPSLLSSDESNNKSACSSSCFCYMHIFHFNCSVTCRCYDCWKKFGDHTCVRCIYMILRPVLQIWSESNLLK